MPISHKIRQYRAVLGFAHPDKVPRSAEPGWGSCAQAGNMVGFYAPNSGWLSMWGLGIGLFEQVAIYHWWFPGLASAISSGL